MNNYIVLCLSITALAISLIGCFAKKLYIAITGQLLGVVALYFILATRLG